jgi:hypothetical protein
MAVATSSGTCQHLFQVRLDNEPGSERGNIKNSRDRVHIDSTPSPSYRHSIARRFYELENQGRVRPAEDTRYWVIAAALAEPQAAPRVAACHFVCGRACQGN